MKFNTAPAAEIPATPQIVLHLVDHLPQHLRSSMGHMQMNIELLAGRDGWIVAKVFDWSRHDVLLKRETHCLQYQCSCPEFRGRAPLPCVHIVLTAIEAAQCLCFDLPDALLPSGLKPLVSARPVAEIRDDGS